MRVNLPGIWSMFKSFRTRSFVSSIFELNKIYATAGNHTFLGSYGTASCYKQPETYEDSVICHSLERGLH